jgi:hypothetical protein
MLLGVQFRPVSGRRAPPAPRRRQSSSTSLSWRTFGRGVRVSGLPIITTAAVGDQKDQPGADLTYAHRPADVVGTAPDRYAG